MAILNCGEWGSEETKVYLVGPHCAMRPNGKQFIWHSRRKKGVRMPCLPGLNTWYFCLNVFELQSFSAMRT